MKSVMHWRRCPPSIRLAHSQGRGRRARLYCVREPSPHREAGRREPQLPCAPAGGPRVPRGAVDAHLPVLVRAMSREQIDKPSTGHLALDPRPAQPLLGKRDRDLILHAVGFEDRVDLRDEPPTPALVGVARRLHAKGDERALAVGVLVLERLGTALILAIRPRTTFRIEARRPARWQAVRPASRTSPGRGEPPSGTAKT